MATNNVQDAEGELQTTSTDGEGQLQGTETEGQAQTLTELVNSKKDLTIEDIMGFENATPEEKAAAVKAYEQKKIQSETDRRITQFRERMEREKMEATIRAREEAERKAREEQLLAENKTEEVLAERTKELERLRKELEDREHYDKVCKLLATKEVPAEFHDFYHLVDTNRSLEELSSFIDGFTNVMEERISAEVERRVAEKLGEAASVMPGGGKTRTVTEPKSIDEQIAEAYQAGDFAKSLELKTKRDLEKRGMMTAPVV